MTVLVTGAGGYLGTTLVPLLVETGEAVVAVDTFLDHPHSREFLGGVACVSVETMDVRDLDEATLERWGIDVVIHLAGLSNDASTAAHPEVAGEVNVRAALRLAEASKVSRVTTFIYASSASVYGGSDGGMLAEDGDLRPISLYAQQKAQVERGLAAKVRDDFQVVCLRKGTLYGPSPKMRFDLVLNSMVAAALRDDFVPLNGGGDQSRPLLHVHDAAKAYLTCVEKAGQLRQFDVLNVATSNNTIGSLAARVSAGLSVPCRLGKGGTDPRSYRIDSNKFWQLAGETSHRDVDRGVSDLVDHFTGRSSLVLPCPDRRLHRDVSGIRS